MNQSVACVPKARELPEGFVYLDELIEDCIIDAKYAGTDNFMGRPADGYEQPLVVASREVAEGCVKAAEILRKQGYLLKVYDAYRPQRAVRRFVEWVHEAEDTRTKAAHYPNVERARMIELGYIAARSGHSRGSTVDLTLYRLDTGALLEMGGDFDLMDVRSHHGAPGISPEAAQNRAHLKELMGSCGFAPYENEWWHYRLENEPYPDTYFDFPIE